MILILSSIIKEKKYKRSIDILGKTIFPINKAQNNLKVKNGIQIGQTVKIIKCSNDSSGDGIEKLLKMNLKVFS